MRRLSDDFLSPADAYRQFARLDAALAVLLDREGDHSLAAAHRFTARLYAEHAEALTTGARESTP